MNRGIIAIFGVAVFFAILFGSLTFETVMAVPAEKQDVCHVDPDNEGAGLETISVKNNKAVTKHLAHGDHLDACFVCGDGFTDPPVEECDDGNTATGDGCDATCQIEPIAVCGDSTITPPEVCDDGNTNDADGCSAFCDSDETCGNGFTDTGLGEVCDDGNTNDADGCSAFCDSNEMCGNGITDTSVGETCDDGNMTSEDGCSDTCQAESCGDGIIQAGLGEDCDGSNLNGLFCGDVGFANGDLACNSSCKFDVSLCGFE